MKNIEQVRRVAIVGTGIMGTGIALAFARAGYQTAAVDTRQENLDRARKTALNACRELVNDGLLKESQVDAVLKNLSLTLDWDEIISQADFIVESVPEILKVKQGVFERCGNLCSPETVVTSTTSSMSISEIAAHMKHPERAVVTHWFVPPHVMRVIEVVPGKGTSDEAVQLTKVLLQKVGKTPVVCKENPGFIHNYIQTAMARAAISLVDMGVAHAEDIDTVVKNGFALRLAQLGPIRAADYAGLETLLHVLEYLYEKTGDSTFKPPAILKEKVAKGELGLKSGKGFYAYSPEEAEKVTASLDNAVMRAASLSSTRPDRCSNVFGQWRTVVHQLDPTVLCDESSDKELMNQSPGLARFRRKFVLGHYDCRRFTHDLHVVEVHVRLKVADAP